LPKWSTRHTHSSQWLTA